MTTKTLQVNHYDTHDILVGEGLKQVPGPAHSSKEHEEVQLVRLEDLHVEEGVAAAAAESEHLVGFLVEDHTRPAAAAGAAVDVEVE